jgi:hypothetical protein
MKKYNNIFLTLVIALLTGLSLTACSDGDDLNTDQYGNDISVNAFGPCPVLRGGTLYFYGTNLDQITEIDIPGADPITAITVITSGTHSEISIQVPAEKCDTGLVSLVTAKGGTLKTVTPITYREDITFDKFYVGQEGNLTGNVGDIVTIKGDYLNLMHGVIFTEKDTVKEDAFVAHDRYTIQVKIPAGARTGVLKLTDLANTPTEIETKDALVINLPTVTQISPTTLKAGKTITITGTSLDQITSIKLEGITVDASSFLSQNATTITFALPDKATDGEVTLVTKSGVDISAGSITTIVPTELLAAPNPVKNGADVTITGKDLDLVTGISFPNADGTIKTASETKIVAAVPEVAQNGNITLKLANGKTVIVAYKLVAPTVTGFTPSTITAGNKLLIRGTDLDLVKSIEFPGEKGITVSDFIAQSATSIGVTVPEASQGSGIILNLKNGETVSISGLTINASSNPSITADVKGTIGEYVTVEGKNFNNVESVYIGETKVTKFTSRTNTSMTFQIPSTVAAGTYDLIMYGYDNAKYTVGKLTAVPAEVDISTFVKLMNGSAITYPMALTWDDTGRFTIPYSTLTNYGIKAGSKMNFYKVKTSTGQVQINDGWWTAYSYLTDWNGTEDVLTLTFDAALIAKLESTGSLVIQGGLPNVTKITIIP